MLLSILNLRGVKSQSHKLHPHIEFFPTVVWNRDGITGITSVSTKENKIYLKRT